MKKLIQLKIDCELHHKLKCQAKKEGRSISNLLRYIIKIYCDYLAPRELNATERTQLEKENNLNPVS